MSSVDVGDAIELTFTTTAGATVTASWIDPDGTTVVDEAPVTEDPAGSGQFPYTFVATAPLIWTAIFRATGTATAVEPFYVRANSISGPAPLATVGEVGELFGTMTAAQEQLVAVLLRRASALVRDRYADLSTRVAAGTLDADMVGLAVVNMVLRVIRNPGQLRSETVGPFSRTYDTRAASGLLEFTSAEAALLAPRESTPTGPARTIIARAGLAPYPEGIRTFRSGLWRTTTSTNVDAES